MSSTPQTTIQNGSIGDYSGLGGLESKISEQELKKLRETKLRAVLQDNKPTWYGFSSGGGPNADGTYSEDQAKFADIPLLMEKYKSISQQEVAKNKAYLDYVTAKKAAPGRSATVLTSQSAKTLLGA